MKKAISLLTLFIFLLTSLPIPCLANPLSLPYPGTMVAPSEALTPPGLKGIRIYPEDPLRFDFILDKGSSAVAGDINATSQRLIKYFLAALTTPEKDLWVNLSPYEKNRIIPKSFGRTDMGRDLLAQDYLLKQLTASIIYPEGAVGKAFWDKVYQQAKERFGTTDIPIDTFNKVWVVSDSAEVFDNHDRAFISKSHLKVLLDSDYMAATGQAVKTSAGAAPTRELTKSVLREIVIPLLENEVNEGKNFAPLRQIYQSFILSVWYKQKITRSLINQYYSDHNKIAGISIRDPKASQKIWARYMQAYQKGVFNYIKEDVDPSAGTVIPKKYFSGGCKLNSNDVSFKPSFNTSDIPDSAQLVEVNAGLLNAAPDVANYLTDKARDGEGYIENTYTEVNEGNTATLRAVLPTAGDPNNYKVTLFSNKTGTWDNTAVLKLSRTEHGKAIFETEVTADRSFEYTFIFDNLTDGSRTWADLPFGNGSVFVNRKFSGSVVMVGMEFGPLVQKGGQADVMYELPRSLVKHAGLSVTAIIPYFKSKAAGFASKVDGGIIEDVDIDLPPIKFNRRPPVKLKVKKATVDGITVYMLDADQDEARDLFFKPYMTRQTEFYESILLSQGAPALLLALKNKGLLPDGVDIVQSNDHHAALVPLYMKQDIYKDLFAKTGRVFTIHNMGYQGEYQYVNMLEELGLEQTDALKSLLINNGKINFMSVPPGVAKLDNYKGYYVGTVSPTYAEEIRPHSFGLNQLLDEMGDHFGGILNGIDHEIKNPATDEFFAKFGLPNYSIDEGIDQVVAARTKIQAFLRDSLAKDTPLPEWENKKVVKHGYLPKMRNTPDRRILCGTIGRNVKQKQIDIIADMLEDMIAARRPTVPIDLIIAGAADPLTDDRLSVDRFIKMVEPARKIGINLVVLDGFVSHEMAALMYGGMDHLLIPSDFEPAGTTQQTAKRFGCIPIGRKTGGLADTIFEGGPNDNGFIFPGTFRRMDPQEDKIAEAQNTEEFDATVRRAVDAFYNDPARTQRQIENGMRDDSSWKLRQQDYLNVYAWLQDQMEDKAQTEMNASKAAVSQYGGIALSSDQLKMTVYSSAAEEQRARFNSNPYLLKKIQRAFGLEPIVVNIMPISKENLKEFLQPRTN